MFPLPSIARYARIVSTSGAAPQNGHGRRAEPDAGTQRPLSCWHYVAGGRWFGFFAHSFGCSPGRGSAWSFGGSAYGLLLLTAMIAVSSLSPCSSRRVTAHSVASHAITFPYPYARPASSARLILWRSLAPICGWLSSIPVTRDSEPGAGAQRPTGLQLSVASLIWFHFWLSGGRGSACRSANVWQIRIAGSICECVPFASVLGLCTALRFFGRRIASSVVYLYPLLAFSVPQSPCRKPTGSSKPPDGVSGFFIREWPAVAEPARSVL